MEPPRFQAEPRRAVFEPTDTPEEELRRKNSESTAAVANRALLRRSGLTSSTSSSDLHATAIQSEQEKWQQLRLLAERELWELVLPICTEMLQFHPANLELLGLQIFAYFAKQQWEEALKTCQQALVVDPDFAYAKQTQNLCHAPLLAQASQHFAAQQWGPAFRDYHALATYFPPDAEILQRLARCYGAHNDWAGVIHCYRINAESCTLPFNAKS